MPASPLLLLVPYRYKAAVLYSQIPISASASGDFVVSRAGDTASRILGNGNIETGVLANIARINYPRTGVASGCAGLLVEPAATNGILNSADTRTSWTLGANLTSGYTDVIGVSGNNLTVAVSGSGIGFALGRLGRTGVNVALASGSTYTISFLMKQTGAHTIGGYYAAITGGAAGDLGGGFDVSGSFSSGSIFTYTGATSRIRRVERFGADVYRCSETFTMTASGTLTNFFVAPLVSVTSFNNSAVGTTMGFAAPQIELGSIPTSFIPTTSAAITRNADVITLSGAVSGCIGQTEGTLYAEFEYRTDTSTRRILALSDGNQINRVMLIFAAGSAFAQINAQSINIGTPVVGYNKAAFGYIQNGVSGTLTASLNGAAVVSGTSAAYPASLNTINVGKIEDATTTSQINARIRSAAIYTSRLTNAELIALSTL
jgi:hypothetical protein